MSDAVWPLGLPQSPLQAKYSQSDKPRALRSSMDVGPAKLRPRVTADVENCTIELLLTGAQVALLKTFWRDTLAGGALSFEWVHHQTGNPIDYRFVDEAPSFQSLSPRRAGTEYWRATFKLEALPGTEVIAPPPPPPPPPPGGGAGGAQPGGGGPGDGGDDNSGTAEITDQDAETDLVFGPPTREAEAAPASMAVIAVLAMSNDEDVIDDDDSIFSDGGQGESAGGGGSATFSAPTNDRGLGNSSF